MEVVQDVAVRSAAEVEVVGNDSGEVVDVRERAVQFLQLQTEFEQTQQAAFGGGGDAEDTVDGSDGRVERIGVSVSAVEQGPEDAVGSPLFQDLPQCPVVGDAGDGDFGVGVGR